MHVLHFYIEEILYMEDKKTPKKSDYADRIDFKILSQPVNIAKDVSIIDGKPTLKRPQIFGIASSECVDLAGDRMTLDALNDIVHKMGPNSTIYLNHSYDVPEDRFGGLAKSPELFYLQPGSHGLLRPTKEYAAVGMYINVDRKNARAVSLYESILEEDALFGLSIGFEIKDYDVIKSEDNIPTGFEFYHIDPLEESVVGIPCNQQSWVTAAGEEIATKSLDFEMITKGYVTYSPPRYETTDTNWAAAATKGLFKRFGVKARWDTESEFIYVLKNYRDFDEITTVYLKQLNDVLNRWGLAIGRLPVSPN